MIAIIDYGLGNLYSLASSLRHIGAEAQLTADPAQIAAAERIILPGVGAFGDAMQRLHSSGLTPVLQQQAALGKPLLGICLGMQLLFERSYEYGEHQGLGLIEGGMYSLADDLAEQNISLKTPHMGWNSLRLLRPDCPLLSRVPEGAYVYFVHSFYGKHCQAALTATAEYGVEVPAVVWQDNVCGCQFHPEKSGGVGLDILRGFVGMKGNKI